jgi:hypothetical protein
LTEPASIRPPIFFSQGSPDVPVQGCSKWKVTLTGGSGITVTRVSIASCGPIVPLVASGATYDPVSKTVTLTVADTNQWSREVVAPSRVYAWNDSIAISTPPGLTNGTNGTYVRLVAMDSTIGAGAATFKNARLWRYDTLLAAHGAPQVLYAAGKSRSRTIQMQVVSGSATVWTVLLRSQSENAHPVPTTAPNVQPTWLKDDTSLFHSTGNKWGGGHISRYVLEVRFKSGTTQLSKQAAVDSVLGIVIGGVTNANVYLIQVPTDNTGALIQEAFDKLQSLSQVSEVLPYLVGVLKGSVRRPNDGNGWNRSGWFGQRDSLHADRWALEAINAPLAWGCDTGSTAARIAIVDGEFYDIPDVHMNIAIQQGLGVSRNNSNIIDAHGTRVASLVAAVGNNGQGMSGVDWKVSLRLYDTYGASSNLGAPATMGGPFDVLTYITTAGQDGADIIELSSDLSYPNRVPGSPNDSFYVYAMAHQLHIAFDTLAGRGLHPLLVVSAGNDAIEAAWGGWPGMKDSRFETDRTYDQQLLVVGGSSRTNGFWSSSNYGPLVDIVAPADNVYSLDTIGLGNPSPVSGTSVAAPLVAGIAGLLKAHDPRLQAWDIKSDILWGSSSSGPDSLNAIGVFDANKTGYWLADAYGALRQAAKDAGAPICGNRVWQQGTGEIVIERGSGDSVEWYGLTDPTQDLARVAHGGDDIELVLGGSANFWPQPLSTLHYDVPTHSWSNINSVDSIYRFPPPPSYQLQQSIALYTHERDSLIRFPPTGPYVNWIQFMVNSGGSWTAQPGYWHITTPTQLGAISPMGDKLVVSEGTTNPDVAVQDISTSPSAPQPIFWPPFGYAPEWMLISEDGDELSLYSVWDRNNWQCEIRYISIYDGHATGPNWNLGNCRSGAAVSPDRVASRRSGDQSRTSSVSQLRTAPPRAPRPSARLVGSATSPRTAPPPPVKGQLSSKRRFALIRRSAQKGSAVSLNR